MTKEANNSTLYYICPACDKEQIVYMTPEVIEDNGNYKFETACSDCNKGLMVKVDFGVNVTKTEEEDD